MLILTPQFTTTILKVYLWQFLQSTMSCPAMKKKITRHQKTKKKKKKFEELEQMSQFDMAGMSELSD